MVFICSLLLLIVSSIIVGSAIIAGLPVLLILTVVFTIGLIDILIVKNMMKKFMKETFKLGGNIVKIFKKEKK